MRASSGVRLQGWGGGGGGGAGGRAGAGAGKLDSFLGASLFQMLSQSVKKKTHTASPTNLSTTKHSNKTQTYRRDMATKQCCVC